ncbi:MAG: lytic transglycosylase domain-containing protein, partial [Chloroflexota bacterium]
ARVSEVNPGHFEAAESLFRAGFLAYNLGRYDDSLTYWNAIIQLPVPGSADKSRANYWLAAASAAIGDADSAAVYRNAAAQADPFDYYGMRAESQMDGVARFPSISALPTEGAPNWTAVETWLKSWAGPEPASATPKPAASGSPTATTAPSPDDLYARGLELLNAGFTDLADQQFRAILDDNSDSPWVEYRMLRQISALDRPTVTAPAAEQFANSHAGAPPELLQIAFPLAYSNLAQKEAADNGFSPFLLLALVRQESTYDPGATAGANDTGLTQVIPDTANEIARQLGDTNFKQADLLRPNVALRYGAHYLATSLTAFDGVLPPAIAGYNAGPGTAAGWWETAGADPDLFLETIDFQGTQTYVKHVLEYYALYLYAYGLTDAPVLPLDVGNDSPVSLG